MAACSKGLLISYPCPFLTRIDTDFIFPTALAPGKLVKLRISHVKPALLFQRLEMPEYLSVQRMNLVRIAYTP